ncbi:MAG TPA: PDZ domain-containing protein [Chitinophagaceae bacterium]|jgi:serine protease Do|nr:PDZ domain-containing protein [Chitinophagaceae bacterium]
MKRLTVNFAMAALLATLSIPSFGQDVKDKEKEEKDKKKEVEQITIVRKTDSKDKTVIEINGDKITVNGKPIEDLKDGDITVHRNKYKTMDGLNSYSVPRGRVGGGGNFNWDNGDGFSYFGSDENRAMLGVVTEEVEGGVKVTELTDESAAKKAGIKEGDIITKIGDTKIEDPDQLSETVRKHKPGEKVAITLLRDKKEQKVTAELGKWKGVSSYSFTPGQNFKMEMPDYNELLAPHVQAMPRMRYGQAWSTGAPRLGLSVQDTDDGKGVKVIGVDEESNAAKAGLKENDIITSFNDKAVNSADEVAKLVKENKDKPTINLKITRNGKTQNVEVKMPRKLKTADL